MFWVPLKIALSLQVKQTIKIHLTTVILLLMYARGSCMRVFARSKPWYLQITALYSCWYGHFCLLKPNKSVFIFSLSSVCFWEHKESNQNKYIIKNKRPAQQHTKFKRYSNFATFKACIWFMTFFSSLSFEHFIFLRAFTKEHFWQEPKKTMQN